MPGDLPGVVAAVPGPPDLASLHRQALPQKDQLCGPFWAALALTAFGHPTEMEAVAKRAGTVLAEGDPSGWLPPGASPRTDYTAPLPTITDETSAGTSVTGLGRAIEELSGGELSVVPVSGPWTAETVAHLVEVASSAPGCVLVANGRTGRLWGTSPDPALLLDHLLGGADGTPAPDWSAGHFLQVLAVVRGPGGSLVALRDTYPTLGWGGHHLQPAGAVAAALKRGDGAEGGVLCVCAASAAGTMRGRFEGAGFTLRYWDNGTPDGGPTP